MGFDEFKSGPPLSVMIALGPRFQGALEAATSYATFRRAIVDLNDNQDRGCFIKAARRYGGVCSAGERELLKALCLLCDFAPVADEISSGEAYVNMTRCGGDFRRAFAACILHAGY